MRPLGASKSGTASGSHKRSSGLLTWPSPVRHLRDRPGRRHRHPRRPPRPAARHHRRDSSAGMHPGDPGEITTFRAKSLTLVPGMNFTLKSTRELMRWGRQASALRTRSSQWSSSAPGPATVSRLHRSRTNGPAQLGSGGDTVQLWASTYRCSDWRTS